jgi:cation:H+ antiporter
MVLEIIALFIGAFVVLVKASDITVDRAVHVAKLTGLSQVAVGAIILALGTSLPELAITIISSFTGESPLAIGMLVGANVADITLMMGITALFGTVVLKKKDVERSWIVLLSVAIAFLIVLRGVIDIWTGIAALVAYFLFTDYTIARGYHIPKLRQHKIARKGLAKEAVVLAAGIVLVIASASILTGTAASIARLYGIHEAVIGAAIIAIGTTLPEMSVSIAAVRKKNSTLAVGNLVGSLITNLGLILGLGALIAPVAINGLEKFILVAFMAIAIMFQSVIASRFKLNRAEGVVLIATFIAFQLLTLAASGFIRLG